MTKWLNIATLEKLKRMDGGFVAVAAAGLPFLLCEGMEVRLIPPVLDAPRTVSVAGLSELRDTSAVVSFDGISTPEDAQRLVGCYCIVERTVAEKAAQSAGAKLTSANLFRGFLGWSVIDTQLGVVGEVVDFAEHPSQTTLTVRDDAGVDHLLPLVDDFLDEIDERRLLITMSLPHGLMDL